MHQHFDRSDAGHFVPRVKISSLVQTFLDRVTSSATRRIPHSLPKWIEHELVFRSDKGSPRQDREALEWAAQISTAAEARLRALNYKESLVLESRRQADAIKARYSKQLHEWNEADHPRHPKGTPIGGEFAAKNGGGKSAGGTAASSIGFRRNSRAAGDAKDPSRWHLPSNEKGEWLGAKGHSVFRLKTPVAANGTMVNEIRFKNGVPVLDPFVLPGKTATIVLTGDPNTDKRLARQVWRKNNPGRDLPFNATFHHDLLNVTEETVTIKGKKVKVLVGKMQLVPREINAAVYHEGSASLAKKFYQGLGIDLRDVARLAKEEADHAGKAGRIVTKALPKIKPGKIAKSLVPLVGRNIARAIPLLGSGLAVLEFAENAEAHGVGGAVARATPVLGDLISAYDLGSDLATQIRTEADVAAGEAQRRLNEPSRKAWELADQQTIAAFHELAPKIKVTNASQSADGASLVDADEIADALFLFREAMQNVNFKRNVGIGLDFGAEAAHHKRKLRERLEHASQKRRFVPQGPQT